ncbi:MAG: hypothetical protein WA733_14220 [Methylocystis sp.]
MTLLTWTLTWLAAAYVLAGAGLAIFQRRLQYFPDRRLTDLAHTGMSCGEELRLTTTDGETLVAWYFPPKDGRPLILYGREWGDYAFAEFLETKAILGVT